MRWALLTLLLVAGCSQATTVQERVEETRAYVKTFQELGVSGRLLVQMGDSHAAGTSWNISGTHAFFELNLPANKNEKLDAALFRRSGVAEVGVLH